MNGGIHMKRLLCCILILSCLLPCFPARSLAANPSDLGGIATNLPTGTNLFLTLYDNGPSDYRWNASGLGELNSDIHLYDPTGANCNFSLTHVEGGWYGIKHIKENGIDRYVDVANKSTADGKVLHIWESEDGKLAGNNHRQFAFYTAGKDAAGNQLYYIKIRHSGKWVGLENNVAGVESNLIQTSVNPRKWYVTPCTVPMKGQELRPWTGNDSLYCELFARNTFLSVSVKNREGNLETDGMGLNLYNIGQSSRFLLRYVSSYQAYEIASTKYETLNGLSLTGKVWDTASEGADTNLNVWSLQSKANNENTSQLWRFLKNSDGSYLIYNARSGKFVSLDGSDLTQGTRSQAQAFELSPLSTTSGIGYGNAFGGSSEELNWMKGIPGTVYLSQVNLPGSHDTGAMAVVQDMNSTLDNLSVTKCQKLYYEEQLATGVRSFDVRCNATSSSQNVFDVKIVHGSSAIQCYDRYGKELTLGEILDISKLFLSKHPSETIVMLVKPDAGTHPDLARTLKAYIEENPNLFWQDDSVPTLREVRGKIVLLRRFLTTSENISLAFGPDLTLWDDQDYDAVKGLVKLPQPGGAQTYVQDAFQQTGGAKKEYISGAIKASAAVPLDNYIYNYTSCTLGLVIDTTREINKWVYEQALSSKRLGNFMFNYNDLMINRKVFRSNSFSQPALDQSISFYHSLNLASDISINYLIPKHQLQYYSDFRLRCDIEQYDGNTYFGTKTVTLDPELRGEYYYFVLEGMTAVQMGDQITAQLIMEDGGLSYTSGKDSYSIHTYALSQLSKSSSTAALKRVCAELLRYGAKAQIFKAYRTNALCDSSMSAESRSYLQELDTVTFGMSKGDTNDLPSAPIAWAGKGLNLDSKIQLVFVFLPGEYAQSLDKLSLRLTYEDIYGQVQETVIENCSLYHEAKGYYAFYFDKLLAAELRQVVSAAVYDGDTQVSSTMEYRADSYGNGKNGNLLELCKAMCAYSDAAKSYFLTVM